MWQYVVVGLIGVGVLCWLIRKICLQLFRKKEGDSPCGGCCHCSSVKRCK